MSKKQVTEQKLLNAGTQNARIRQKEREEMTNQEQYELICEKAKKYDRLVDVLDKIRSEIASYKDDDIIHAERNEMIDIVLEIIDKYRGDKNETDN